MKNPGTCLFLDRCWQGLREREDEETENEDLFEDSGLYAGVCRDCAPVAW